MNMFFCSVYKPDHSFKIVTIRVKRSFPAFNSVCIGRQGSDVVIKSPISDPHPIRANISINYEFKFDDEFTICRYNGSEFHWI
jgi:hypothetical protein